METKDYLHLLASLQKATAESISEVLCSEQKEVVVPKTMAVSMTNSGRKVEALLVITETTNS